MKNNIFKTLSKFKISKTEKRIFNFVGGILLSACCFIVTYLTFQNGWTNLDEVDKVEGVIIEKGITNNHGNRLPSKVFYFKLEGFNQTLGVYNPSNDYVSLSNNLKVGDTIKVFYKHSNLIDQINLETFQIEKHNQIILISQDFQSGEKIGFLITLVSGFVLLFMTFYQDRKHYL